MLTVFLKNSQVLGPEETSPAPYEILSVIDSLTKKVAVDRCAHIKVQCYISCIAVK